MGIDHRILSWLVALEAAVLWLGENQHVLWTWSQLDCDSMFSHVQNIDCFIFLTHPHWGNANAVLLTRRSKKHSLKQEEGICGNHVLLLSQQYLLEFNITHSLFLAWSFSCSWVNRSSWHVNITKTLFYMRNNPPYLQRPFFGALMWFPLDLQEVASLIPEFWSLSCFTALKDYKKNYQ